MKKVYDIVESFKVKWYKPESKESGVTEFNKGDQVVGYYDGDTLFVDHQEGEETITSVITEANAKKLVVNEEATNKLDKESTTDTARTVFMIVVLVLLAFVIYKRVKK
jgi:hypothetical protein